MIGLIHWSIHFTGYRCKVFYRRIIVPNPGWFKEIKLFSIKKEYIWLQSRRSNILPKIGRSETGPQFLIPLLSFFLWADTTLTFFYSKRKIPSSIQETICEGLQISLSYSLIIHILILLWSWALFGSNDIITICLLQKNILLTEIYLFLEKCKLVEYCYFQSKNIVKQRKY